MAPWIRLFSKFTPEALLLEALLICLLVASYAAFWVLRKRRYGSAQQSVPAGLVRTHLNELILDAERLRAQLFGLLGGASAGEARLREGPSIPASGEFAGKLSQLEGKLSEQARSMETLQMEKSRLAQELQAARTLADTARAPGAPGEDAGAIAKLQEKIRLLEGKLQEYSVIEDDLANLKRLTQENAQLRAALGQPARPVAAATSAPASEAPAAKAAPAPAPEPVPTATPAAAPSAVELPAEPAFARSADAVLPNAEPELLGVEALETADSVVAASPASEPGFDQLAAEVEKSLEPAAASASAMPQLEEVTPAAPPLPKTDAGPAAPPAMDKSDADLVAEFEKMLNG